MLFGFNEWPNPANYALQRSTGGLVRRISIGWNQIEATRGSYDWTSTDARYRSVRDAGLRPLLLVSGAPCWAHPSTQCNDPNGIYPPEPAFDSQWSAFFAALAQHYPDAVGIEVWNEENILPEWLPGPDPVRYAQLLKGAYTAVKSVAPSMPVISGGLMAATASGGWATADSTFLSGIYKTIGTGYMDGIGTHPYLYAGGSDGTPLRYEASSLETTLSRLRAVRDQAHDRTPFWVTETGESTATQAGFPAAATDQQQSSDILAAVQQAISDGDVAVLLVHRLQDTSPTLNTPYAAMESGFGVFRADGTPKPAACALSGLWGGSLHC
jgi:hypothetical protein